MSDTEKSARIASVMTRIVNLRAALEDPSLLTEISIDGIAERLDRAQARAELRELEAEYDRLTGRTSRVYGIDLQ